MARHGIVVALVDFRERIAFFLCEVVHALHVLRRIVAQAEAFEEAEFVGFIDTSEGIFEWHVGRGRVHVKYVELLDVDFLNSLLDVRDYYVLAR